MTRSADRDDLDASGIVRTSSMPNDGAERVTVSTVPISHKKRISLTNTINIKTT